MHHLMSVSDGSVCASYAYMWYSACSGCVDNGFECVMSVCVDTLISFTEPWY